MSHPAPHVSVYLDHAATCPPIPVVVSAMVKALQAGLGNPGSRQHAPGRAAAETLEQARHAIATLVGIHPETLVFTSGASEALSQAILGVMERSLAHRPDIAVVADVHVAVRSAVTRVEAAGGSSLTLRVDSAGRLVPEDLDEIGPRTALVVASLVNNETGVIVNVEALRDRCLSSGALLLLDASQAPLRHGTDLKGIGADLAVLSAHKMHGPMGIGGLYIRHGLDIPPLIMGGGQENRRRGGTPAVAAAAGWGAAANWLHQHGLHVRRTLTELSNQLENELSAALPGLVIHGSGNQRAPGILMMSHPHMPTGWLTALPHLALSGGSACSIGSPSHTLLMMGVPTAQASNALRISLGAQTTRADMDLAIQHLVSVSRRLIGLT